MLFNHSGVQLTRNRLSGKSTDTRPTVSTFVAPVERRSSSQLAMVRRGAVPAWEGEYNESMNCQAKDELVSQLVALNNKLNLLSPDLVHGDKERAEVQERRESLYAEIKHHRAKGHEGKPCPAARRV